MREKYLSCIVIGFLVLALLSGQTEIVKGSEVELTEDEKKLIQIGEGVGQRGQSLLMDVLSMAEGDLSTAEARVNIEAYKDSTFKDLKELISLEPRAKIDELHTRAVAATGGLYLVARVWGETLDGASSGSLDKEKLRRNLSTVIVMSDQISKVVTELKSDT